MSGKPLPHHPHWILRHSVVVRVTHWINVVCLLVLLMSGLQIFNAHPALYWGQQSDFDHPVLAMTADHANGVTTILGHAFHTTGVLGLSAGPDGTMRPRGFPAWATLPGDQWLSMGRRWHLFFAWVFVLNGAVYLTSGFASGHFRRDLLPSRAQLAQIGQTLRDHLRLRFPKGDEARHYNVLQKLAYLAVVFVALPLIVLAGLAMSPQLDSVFPLVSLFDGRQTARTIHFLCAAALVVFVLIHVAMVLLTGVWNNLRAMITGRFVIHDGRDHHDPTD